MKTPRTLLLDQHRHMLARLNAVRAETVHAVTAPPETVAAPAPTSPGLLASCWQELFVRCRQYWLGLGVAWAVVLLFAAANAPGGSGARVASASPAQVQAAAAQWGLRNELLGGVTPIPPDSDADRARPRSDRWRQERYA
jgi:hypothetical protein